MNRRLFFGSGATAVGIAPQQKSQTLTLCTASTVAQRKVRRFEMKVACTLAIAAIAISNSASAQSAVKLPKVLEEGLAQFPIQLLNTPTNFESLMQERIYINHSSPEDNSYNLDDTKIVRSDARVSVVTEKNNYYYDTFAGNSTSEYYYSYNGMLIVGSKRMREFDLRSVSSSGNFPFEVGSTLTYTSETANRPPASVTLEVMGVVENVAGLDGLCPCNLIGSAGNVGTIWSTVLKWPVATLGHSDSQYQYEDSGDIFLGVKLGRQQIGLARPEAVRRAESNPMNAGGIAARQAQRDRMAAAWMGLATTALQTATVVAGGQPIASSPYNIPSINPAASALGVSASGGLGNVRTTSALAPSGQAAASANGCPRNLLHIAGQLPSYRDPELTALRQEILAFDPVTHFDQLVAAGNSPMDIAGAAAEQAAEAERAMPSAVAVIASVTDSPAPILAQLRAGTFVFDNGIVGSAAKAWAAGNYMVIANRETAVILACMAR